MKLAQGGDEDDAGGMLVDAIFSKRPTNLSNQGCATRVEVIAVMEGQRADSVIAEPEGTLVQLFQFAQIQGKEVEAIAKAVLDFMGTGVAKLPGKKFRVHAISCKSLTAWTLERTASS